MDHRGKSHLLLHSKNPYIFSNYAVRFCATHCCKAGGLKEKHSHSQMFSWLKVCLAKFITYSS